MDEKIKSNDINELAVNFERFITKEKQNTRKRNIAYIVSTAIVFCFLTYISIFTAKYIGPNLIFDYVQVKGAQQLVDLNLTIKNAAPKVVKEWSQTLSTTMPKMFHNKMYSILTPPIDAFASKFSKDLRIELANLYKKDKMKDVILGKADAKEGFKQLFNQINLSYTKEVTDFYTNNVKAVHGLKDDLLTLKNNKNPTTKEKYAKKVIGAWLALLDHKGAMWNAEEVAKEINAKKK